MTRIIATVGTVAALLFAPALPLVAAHPFTDVDPDPVVAPLTQALASVTDVDVEVIVDVDDPVPVSEPDPDPVPTPDPPDDPSPAPLPTPVESAPTGTTPTPTTPTAMTPTGTTGTGYAAPPTDSTRVASTGRSVRSSAGTVTGQRSTTTATVADAATPAPLLSPDPGETLRFTARPTVVTSAPNTTGTTTAAPATDGSLLMLMAVVAGMFLALIGSRAIWLRFART